MPWFDDNWDHRVEVVIQASKVDANLTDYPVFVDLSDLPAGFFASVQSGGGDIRVTQSDGVTQQAREIVVINTGSSTGIAHFKASSISSVPNT